MRSWTNVEIIELISKKNEKLLKEIIELKELVRELKIELVLLKKDLEK